jgi:xanthine/uracil permease
MIVSVGVRTLTENEIDFKKFRNWYSCGLSGWGVPITILSSYTYHLSSLFIAAIVGIILNKALPNKG